MVDVLLPGDLDDVGPGPVSGSYIPVALGDDSRDDEVPVLGVHVRSLPPELKASSVPSLLFKILLLDILLFAAFVSALNIQRDPQL